MKISMLLYHFILIRIKKFYVLSLQIQYIMVPNIVAHTEDNIILIAERQ